MFYTVKPMPTESDTKVMKTIGLRLYESDIKRLNVVLERVKKRNRYMDQSKTLREVIGFTPRQFVTDEDIAILSGEIPIDESTGTLAPVVEAENETAGKKRKKA